MIKQEKEALLRVIRSEIWGTVGPEFLKANELLAKLTGSEHALLTFSATAALESILRGWEIGFGDEVIVGALTLPEDTSVLLAVGAAPVFCDCEKASAALSPAAVTKALTPNTKAILADLPCDLPALRAVADKKGVKLIVNMGKSFLPFPKEADAAVVDLSEGCAVDLGLAGAALGADPSDFDRFYAAHNCGRPLGDGATLSFDETVGGDLRISEFQATILCRRLEEGVDFRELPSSPVLMPAQPLMADPYVEKLTGRSYPYTPEAFPNAVALGKEN